MVMLLPPDPFQAHSHRQLSVVSQLKCINDNDMNQIKIFKVDLNDKKYTNT